MVRYAECIFRLLLYHAVICWWLCSYGNNRWNTSNFRDMLQRLNWRSFEDRCKDARLVMSYKEQAEMYWKGLSHPTLRPSPNMHSSFFITPPCKTQQRLESFSSYDVTMEPAATACSFESLGWSIKCCRLLYHIWIYETWK